MVPQAWGPLRSGEKSWEKNSKKFQKNKNKNKKFKFLKFSKFPEFFLPFFLKEWAEGGIQDGASGLGSPHYGEKSMK